MLDHVLRAVSPYLLPIAALVIVVAVAWGSVQTWRIQGLETDLAQERAARAEETAQREHAARVAQQKIASLQAEHAAQQQEATRAFNVEIEAARAAAAAAGADADRLRRDIEAFASGGGGRAGADATACGDLRDRTASLGHLLARADRLAERLTGAAERHANEVRALQRQLSADRAACGGGDAR